MTLDIDDTCDVVHGNQQLRCSTDFMTNAASRTIHVYDTGRSAPVAVVLRPGKTPSRRRGADHLHCGAPHPARWKTRASPSGAMATTRGQAMDWCEASGVDYVFERPGRRHWRRKSTGRPTPCAPNAPWRTKPPCAITPSPPPRRDVGPRRRRAVARIEATKLGLDIRFVVTNIETGTPQWLYDTLYCARGQAENLIKLHKGQLASDRTSCRSPVANQVRLALHHGGLLADARPARGRPQGCNLARAEFATLRLRLVKIAARVIETAGRVRLAFAAGCPKPPCSARFPAPSRPRALNEGAAAPPPATAPPTFHRTGLQAAKSPDEKPRSNQEKDPKARRRSAR